MHWPISEGLISNKYKLPKTVNGPGVFYEKVDSIDNFKELKTLFDGNMRHSSVLVIGDTLYIRN